MYAGFVDIVNLYTVVGGLAMTLLRHLHGLMFIQSKTDGDIRRRANAQAIKLHIACAVRSLYYTVVSTGVYTNALADRGNILIPAYALAIVLYLALYSLLKNKKEGWSFTATGLIITLNRIILYCLIPKCDDQFNRHS